MRIEPEPYEIVAEDAVNLLGRSFSFTHQKVLVEWIKNSWDAYQREPEKIVTDRPYIILEFRGSRKSFRKVRLIDFCGMEKADIDGAFKRWFDMRAATKGLNKNQVSSKILGGHGNGGKFYMRQMFGESTITTWQRGRLSSFGFNPKKEYGFVEGRKDVPCDPLAALKLADVDLKMVPADVLDALADGICGFTVVEGWKPKGTGVQTQWGHVIKGLREQPQMALLLDFVNMAVWVNGERLADRLRVEKPSPHPDVETVCVEMPMLLAGEDQQYSFEPMLDGTAGVLEVTCADRPLTGRLKAQNRLDVIGEFGVIATYPISELPVSQVDGAEFLFAVLTSPCLESGEKSLVENARERLIPSPKTSALIKWVSETLDDVAKSVSKHNEKERKKLQAAETARLSRMLNTYARQFLTDFYTEVTGGLGEGVGFGGTGGGGGAAHTNGKGKGKKSSGAGDEGSDGGGSGDKKARARRFPEIRIAGIDPDPFSESGDTLVLGERYPTLYQRAPIDVEARLYWINTEAPYPRFVLSTFGENSSTWKSYILMRHRDVVIKEALRHMTEREGLDLSLENVNNRMDELTDQFLNLLDQDVADAIIHKD